MIEFLDKYRDFIYIVICVLLCIFISMQAHKINDLDKELSIQINNHLATLDTLNTYVDELGRMNAEKHAYQLTQEELRDSIGLLKKKNYEYVSYISSHLNISDTIYIETYIDKKDSDNIDNGIIKLNKSDTFGKSNRNISINIPYNIKDNRLITDSGTIHMNQDIFVEGWLERNKKTDETYIHLRTDYPGVVFNSGTGIIAESSKSYERSMRKSCGIGLCVGPGISLGYDFINKQLVPTVGVNLTIGFTYTPKILQW